MFKKLIQVMREDRTYSQYELARELGISEEVLESYIEYLYEQGYLLKVDYREAHAGCSSNCSCCKSCKGRAGEEAFENAPTLWEFNKAKV